jgi:hypothetical protein
MKKQVIELLNTLSQLASFIGFSYLLLNNTKQAIGLGFIVCLIWWKLEKIAKSFKK